MTCPTCGRGRGTQAKPDLERKRTCWACGKAFIQRGPGRARVICEDPTCARKRVRFRRYGGSSLEVYQGEPEAPLHVPARVFQHALGHGGGRP